MKNVIITHLINGCTKLADINFAMHYKQYYLSLKLFYYMLSESNIRMKLLLKL